MSHLELIAEIEKEYEIEFTKEEILQAKSVGKIISYIEAKIKWEV